MTKYRRNILFCLCAALLCLCAATAVVYSMLHDVVSVHATKSSNATVSGYEEQIKDLENKEKELKSEIESLKSDSSKALKLKTTLDAQLAVTYEKIDAAQKLITELELHIANTEADIADMQQKLEEQEQIFMQRLRLAHEKSDVSYIAMLFEADGLSEFFNNIERVGALLDYDKKVMAKYTQQKSEFEDAMAELEAQMQKQTEYKSTLAATEAELEAQIEEADALIVKLNKDKNNYEDELKDIRAEEAKLEAELEAYLKKLQEEENKNYMVEGQLQWPVKSSVGGYNKITSWYGYRNLSVGGNDVSNHKGIDIAVRYVDVYACGKGTVVTSTYSKSYGYYIVIDHGGGVSTLYAHLSKLSVKKGASVEAGQKIGVTGNTGWSTGPHLHLELRINGAYKNPLTTKDSKGNYYLSRPSKLIDAS